MLSGWRTSLYMDNPLEQRLALLFLALFLAAAISWMAFKNGFYRLPGNKKFQRPNITAGEVFSIFTIFLFTEIFIVPSIVILWLSFKAGHFLQKQDVRIDDLTNGWLQVFAILISSLAVFFYAFIYNSEKRDEIFWGGIENKKLSRAINNGLFGAMTWIISYPMVVVVSQAVGLLLYVIGPELHVDQLAVKHLKETMRYPVLFYVTICVVIFIVPVAEEILFRGYLQNWLIKTLGVKKGIGVTALFFAFFHFSMSQKWDNIELLISLFILACFLGFIYERQRTLWSSIGLHVTFNGISVIMIIWQPT